MKDRTSPSRAVPPPLLTPAARVAVMLALPAVSQADRMMISASSFRSKISSNASSPSELSSPKEVTRAGFAGQDGLGAVTKPWVAKCRMR